jgi:plastocyanin
MLSRRHVLGIGGVLLAAPLSARRGLGQTDEPVEIAMRGNADGSQVWFDPVGIVIRPGQTVRWINRDPGNSHTATAYHPQNSEKPLRIPERAIPWNSDYLLPNESFSVTLTLEGVYDYFCIPHEHAGMVGRIVVGRPGKTPAEGVSSRASGGEPIPEEAIQAFPPVDEIVRRGVIRPS